jgi:hypothetical protein
MCAYIGDDLAPLFRSDPSRLIAAITRAGIERWQEVTTKNTPIRLGNLRTSWYIVEPRPRLRGGWEARVATNVEYAPHVERGTGKWGPTGLPYPIRSRKPGGFLRFKGRGGETVYAREVQHPGSPGQHMLAIGGAIAEHELEAIARPIMQAWIEAQERRGS